MSYRRQKQARKVLEFYSNNFGLKGSPYNVLIDVTFVRAALLHKVDLREQIPGYLGGHAKFFTTTCAVREAEAFGTSCGGKRWRSQRMSIEQGGFSQLGLSLC